MYKRRITIVPPFLYIYAKGSSKTDGLCGDFYCKVATNPIPPASLRTLMSQPEEDPLSEEKRKKDGYSIIVALIAVLIIGISFIWHLWSALFPAPKL